MNRDRTPDWRRSLSISLASVALQATSAAASFDVTTVQDRHGVGTASAGVDPDGRSVMAYGSRSLFYAVRDVAGWQIETVEQGCGGDRGASLAFDPAGNQAISFHDDADALKLARWDGSGWAIQTIDDTVTVAGATSLAFDGAGEPAIAYYDQTNEDLRYASWDGASFVPTTVDGAAGSVGEYPSLAFDPTGDPAIGYYDRGAGDLRFARQSGGAWQIEVVDGGASDAGRYASLAFAGNGFPALSYSVDSGSVDIMVALWNGVSWELENLEFTRRAAGTSIGYDGSGDVAVAYFADPGAFNGKLRYATRAGPADWTVVSADGQFDAGYFPSLAFDGAGNPVISYLDGQNGTLKLTRSDGLGFRSEHVDSSGPSDGSVAFDGLGQPGISYGDGRVAGLMFGRWDGTDWQRESVDGTFWSGSVSSLRFDPANNPVIAYDDRYDGHIKLARWDGASWQLEVVYGPSFDPTAPTAPALALDRAGNPGVAFHWPGSFYLQFARWDGSSWDVTTVASGLPFEFWADRTAAFDAADNPAVVYSDFSDQLWLGRWNGATWDNELVDPGPAVRGTLVFDGAGEPLVAYWAPPDEVRLAREVGGVWTSEPVATGSPTNIALDADGEPVIAYFDDVAGEVRLARWDGATWTPETVAVALSAGVVAIDAHGSVAVGLRTEAGCRGPEVALELRAIAVHRGVVASVAPGWKGAAVPLTSLNDDETPPFPSASRIPGGLTDSVVPDVPLVLYRVLEPGDLPAGNSLRVTRDTAGRVVIAF